MSRKDARPGPERAATQLAVSVGGGPLQVGLVAATERLINSPEWAAVMVFRVGGGDTRLLAHAVLPTPATWSDPPPAGRIGAQNGRQRWLNNVAGALAAWLPGDDQSQLTTRMVRSATSSGLELYARQYARQLEGFMGVPRGATSDPLRKHRGGRGGGDLNLARIAARYVELAAETTSPKVALVAETGMKPNTLNSNLHKARERGLLTSAGAGKAGGALTERARQLLNEQAEDQR